MRVNPKARQRRRSGYIGAGAGINKYYWYISA